MPVSILKFATSSPADTTPLKELRSAGYDSTDIIAVVGKTEGESLPLFSPLASSTPNLIAFGK
jgi:hypothetical protein